MGTNHCPTRLCVVVLAAAVFFTPASAEVIQDRIDTHERPITEALQLYREEAADVGVQDSTFDSGEKPSVHPSRASGRAEARLK